MHNYSILRCDLDVTLTYCTCQLIVEVNNRVTHRPQTLGPALVGEFLIDSFAFLRVRLNVTQ